MEKQKKTKKKHRFLKFLLFVALTIAVCVLVEKGCDKWAEKEMKGFVNNYPFSFSAETDSLNYITSDFAVIDTYEVNDKKYTVEWESDDETIVFNGTNAVVHRPDREIENVTIKQIYKKLFGEAERVYQVSVIPSNEDTLTTEEIEIVEIDANEDIQVERDEEGNLNYILGDFDGTYINSVEDAMTVLKAYCPMFNVQTDVNFVLKNITDTTLLKSYHFYIDYEGIKIGGASANVTVYKDTNELTKLSINIDETNLENINLNEGELTEEEIEGIIREYINENDETNKQYQVVIYQTRKMIYNQNLVAEYICYFENGAIYTAYFDLHTNEVVKYFTDEYSAYRPAKCTGVNEYGETISFDASYKAPYSDNQTDDYRLYDVERDIHIFDNNGWWKLYNEVAPKQQRDEAGVIEMIGAILDYSISNKLNAEIKSKTSHFADAEVAVQVLKNIQDSYDWYLNTFNLISYDNQGAPIVVLTDCHNKTDNASWNGSQKVFIVNPMEEYKYSFGNSLAVMGHEYTHAVFGSKMSVEATGSHEELDGLNEAYADIFGYLIEGNEEWILAPNELVDGTPVYVRESMYINDTENKIEELESAHSDRVYPETYKDENWIALDGECHAISVMISHVAYLMYNSDWFTAEDVARIWYDSLGYGYDASATYLTCRRYVIQAADENGYSGQQVDYIAACFDKIGVLDESYERRVKEIDTTGMTPDQIKKMERENADHAFLVFYSPAGIIFGESGIYIYESSTGATDEELAELSRIFTEKATEQYGDISLVTGVVQVEYRQVPPFVMDTLCKICEKTENYMREISLNALDLEEEEADSSEVLDWVINLSFRWQITRTSRSEFLESFGIENEQ